MTTFDLFRRASVPAAAVALLSLAACSGTPAPAPAATVTVTATPAPATSATAPAASASAGPVADPTGDDAWPPISDKTPPIFGSVFQSDPGHDFTRGISPSRDGVVRGQLRTMQDANVVEYVPVRFARTGAGQTSGHFVGPDEGDSMAFAAPIAGNAVFLSAVGCNGKDQTIDSSYVGTQSCPRDVLISRADKGDLFALITVQGSQIVKVVEIYTP